MQLVVASSVTMTQSTAHPSAGRDRFPALPGDGGGRWGLYPAEQRDHGQQEPSVRLLQYLEGGKEPELECLEGRAGRTGACCLGTLVIPVSRQGELIVFAAGCLPPGMPVVEGKVFPWL